MAAAGREDLANDERLAENSGRVEHEDEIDEVLQGWALQHDADDLLQLLQQAEVPSAPIYSVADMFEDEHFRKRGMIETVEYEGKTLEVPALHPRLAKTPGGTNWAGPTLGAHTDEVLTQFLGCSADDIVKLRKAGIV